MEISKRQVEVENESFDNTLKNLKGLKTNIDHKRMITNWRMSTNVDGNIY